MPAAEASRAGAQARETSRPSSCEGGGVDARVLRLIFVSGGSASRPSDFTRFAAAEEALRSKDGFAMGPLVFPNVPLRSGCAAVLLQSHYFLT
jgi:hypothetical protein